MWPRLKLAGKRVAILWLGSGGAPRPCLTLCSALCFAVPNPQAARQGVSCWVPSCPGFPCTWAETREKAMHPSGLSGCNSITGKCKQALWFPCSPAGKMSTIMYATWCSGISTSSRLWGTSYDILFQWLLSACLFSLKTIYWLFDFSIFSPFFCPFFSLQLLLIMLLELLLTSCKCVQNFVMYLTKSCLTTPVVWALWLGFAVVKTAERKITPKTTERPLVSKSSLQPDRKYLSVACHRLLCRELAQVI